MNVQYILTDNRDFRFGLSVSKRVGKAVKRNRVKRQLREAIRKLILEISTSYNGGFTIVVIAKPPILKADFADIYLDLKSCFSKTL